MHFICPKCERPLSKLNSWHYCKKISIDDLFMSKPASLRALYNKLAKEMHAWEGVSFSATKSCIVFLSAKTFLVVKVMKNELDLKFPLPAECDEFPIYKRAAYGKKVEHHIRLRDEDDLDGDVFKLLHRAYQMVSG
ncbi:MAG TPA: DUF5655 domain-containing protein [Flavisolibacter sp.]